MDTKPKQIWIEWTDPLGPLMVPMRCRVLREDAIKHSKEMLKRRSNGTKEYKTDEEALWDFIVVNWADEIKE